MAGVGAWRRVDADWVVRCVAEARRRERLVFGAVAGLVAAAFGALIWGTLSSISGLDLGSLPVVGVGVLAGRIVRTVGRGSGGRAGLVGAGVAVAGSLLVDLYALGIPVMWQTHFMVAEPFNIRVLARLLVARWTVVDSVLLAVAAAEGFLLARIGCTLADKRRLAGETAIRWGVADDRDDPVTSPPLICEEMGHRIDPFRRRSLPERGGEPLCPKCGAPLRLVPIGPDDLGSERGHPVLAACLIGGIILLFVVGYFNMMRTSVVDLAVAPDGRFVAVSTRVFASPSRLNTLRVYDPKTGGFEAEEELESSVHALAYSPRGLRLGSAGPGKQTRLL